MATTAIDIGKETIHMECRDCGGTGVYVGPFQEKGTGVVCNLCEGDGCLSREYTPFTGRKQRDGIQTVFRSGHKEVTIPYAEFLCGTMPEKPKEDRTSDFG